MTAYRSDWITNEEIWEEYRRFVIACLVVMGNVDQEVASGILLAGDGIAPVAHTLGLSVDTVGKVVNAMLDPNWSQLYERLVFPLERAWVPSPEDETHTTDEYVYLMTDPFTGYCKIGHSNDPDRRVNELNRNIPPGGTNVRLVHRFKADNAVEAELTLHEFHDEKRIEIKGGATEWFDLDGFEVHVICDIAGYEKHQFIYRGLPYNEEQS